MGKAKYPVVVYGASGYTGMLIMDWLIDEGIPFSAVARDAARADQMMKSRVVGLEHSVYEIIECQHDVDALAKVFRGARVVCNTVGPFLSYGLVGVEAALKAGCHYLDTTGEQQYIRSVQDQFGKSFAEAGLLCAPSTAYMHTVAEIGAELALETPGIDTLDIACLPTCLPTVGSSKSIVQMFDMEEKFLKDNQLVDHPRATSYEIACPDYLTTMFALPWGAASHPVIYENDPRVRNCRTLTGFANAQDTMRGIHAFAVQWEDGLKDLPEEERNAALAQLAGDTAPTMPPRERLVESRNVDYIVGRGNLASVQVSMYSVAPYITTGAVQAAAVCKLLENDTRKVGFASACQAFGHDYLLAYLEERGLCRAKVY